MVSKRRADGSSGAREKRARITLDGLRPGSDRAGAGGGTEPKMSLYYQRTGYHDGYLVSRITM
jgi:hypothetical protein